MKKFFWIFSLLFVIALPFVLTGCNEHKLGETVSVDDLEITVNNVNVQPTAFNLNKVVLVNVTVKNVGSSVQNIVGYATFYMGSDSQDQKDYYSAVNGDGVTNQIGWMLQPGEEEIGTMEFDQVPADATKVKMGYQKDPLSGLDAIWEFDLSS